MKLKPLAFALMFGGVLTACGGGSSNSSDPVVDTPVDDTPVDDVVTIEAPSTYTFETQFDGFDEGQSAVSYTGQTARQMFIEAIVTQTLSYTADQIGPTAADIAAEMEAFFDNDGSALDTQAITYSIDGETLLPQNDSSVTTYGSISSDKSLVGKIAGNDTGMDSDTMTDGLVNGEFFGWDSSSNTNDIETFTATGEAGARPEDFVRHLFLLLGDEVTNGTVPSVTTASGVANLDVSYVDGQGRDYRQLIQKFLLGAVTFSQGTSDYLQTDFSADNVQDGTSAYTSGAHDWDEAFGYFGAARDYGDYTDDEIADVGYNDTNADGSIDLRSEVNLANSTNCAKRDRGAVNDPDFTTAVFDAFIAGRTILNNGEAAAAAAGGQVDLTDEQIAALEEAGNTAALTWEKCIAATVVHYINDTTADVEAISGNAYTDLDHYKDLAKHWAEMKGFALGLQFNVESPIYDSAENLAAFKAALTAMGTEPVLASATDQEIADYLAGLATARDTFQDLYDFDADNVENW